MPSYQIEIVVNGKDNASAALGNVHSALGNIAQIAAGGVIAAGIVNLGNAFAGAAQHALGSVAGYERMGLSLQALAAREIQREATQTRLIAVGTAVTKATGEQTEKMSALSLKVREAQFRYDDMARSQAHWPKDPIKAGLNQVELEQRAASLAKLKGQYDALAGSVGKTVTIYQTETTTTKTREQAWAEAATRAKELQTWVAKLAILSPFNQDDIAQAFRMNMAYGFTTKEAQRLTQATLDFSAATGGGGEVMQRVALALGQIQAKGKLAGGEVLQLTNAGINVRDILARAFGKTTGEIMNMQERGLIPAKAAIEAIVKSLEDDFGGAAKTQAGSLSGLTSSLEDLKQFAEIDLFQPLFKSLTPLLNGLVNLAQQPAIKTALQDIGRAIGGIISQPFGGVIGFIDKLNDLMTGEVKGDDPRGKLTNALGLGEAFRVAFKESFPDAAKVYEDVKKWWDTQVAPKFKSGFTIENLLDFANAQIVNITGAAAVWLNKLAESGEVERFAQQAGELIGKAIRIVLSFSPEQMVVSDSGLASAGERIGQQLFDGIRIGLEKGLAGFDIGTWLSGQIGKTWGTGGTFAGAGNTILKLLGVNLPTGQQIGNDISSLLGLTGGRPFASIFGGPENADGANDSARWVAIGQAYMSGIAQGAASESSQAELSLALRTVTDNGIQELKTVYGIQSPSLVMATTVGGPLVQGMALGATQEQAFFAAALMAVISTSNSQLLSEGMLNTYKLTGAGIVRAIAAGAASEQKTITDQFEAIIRQALTQFMPWVLDEIRRNVRGG